MKPPSIRFVVALAGCLAVLVAVPAFAATRNGITPVSPKAGASVAAGKSPTFKSRVVGQGQVWVHVCKSAKKDADGVICHTASIGQARKKGSTHQFKPRFYDFPAFWLNTPGTYHWQAFRIQCTGTTADCKQEGPVVKFRVR